MSNSWQGQRVVILGAARQGTALARYLIAHGAEVTLSDLNPHVDQKPLTGLPLRWVLGEHPLSLLDRCDLLCLSGGVPTDLPIVLEARRRGIPLSNEAQVFCEACPAPIIGITGSAGKTTTTTLTGEMLRAEFGSAVWVGGNIGNPLISDLEHIRAADIVVMELSSFQLELMTCSPHIACITNITPNHLDRHGTMEAYLAAKQRILNFQSEQDWRVLCADDPASTTLPMTPRTAWFSLRPVPLDNGAWLDADGILRLRLSTPAPHPIDAVICHRNELQLMGDHNVLNVLAAACLAGLAGASTQAIRQVAITFRGVPHRLQLVAERRGARWYNDSIATTPERLMAGLRCFDQPVILLCGGRDKHLPWDEALGLMRQQCKAVICFGELGPMVASQLSQYAPPPTVHLCHTLQEAVRVADQLVQPGDVVLLSPGGTSYDAFHDFAERGARFTEWVHELP
ncbi:MAG: UDP-N-acetylmuramoyl-L-alanine--D-glutamate ligase [Thermoflexales bacterium]